MPFTQETYNGVVKQCNKIWEPTSNIVYVPDGTIFVETPNGDGSFTTYQMNDVCCKALKNHLISIDYTLPNGVSPENIQFNLDEQKCRWAPPVSTQCSTTETNDIKIVLNPVGNDGAFFTLTENDSCGLKIKFDYLFKVKCETLKNIPTSYTYNKNGELDNLRQLKFNVESELLDVNNQIDNLSIQNANLSYSIVCDEFPVITTTDSTTTTTTDITQIQKLPFTNTGFGSLTNSTDLSNSTSKVKPIYESKTVTFGLTETGLTYWRKILGDINYLNFIDGDPKSYTCTDVIEIEKLNQEALLNFSPNLLFETTTPFGEKTKIINSLSELSKVQAELKNKLVSINEEIVNNIKETSNEICSTLLGQFKSITADMTLDMIDENNVTTQFYVENLFYPLSNSTPTLYQYLVNSGDNSGFLVCGEPNVNETWASGCTGLIYPEFTNGVSTIDPLSDEINVSICDLIKDQLYSELLLESGYLSSEIDLFNQSLSPNVFNSNWLTFEKTFDASEVTGLTNNRIVLNIVIRSSCGDLCLLVDQISLTKICSDIDRTNIFISQSPGFELTKIIDNKKSWIEATEYTDREFYIGNYDDTNKIRQTEYSVDEERLILNSKEIDLTMNMASAVENDVWCYLLDNPNLLTGTTNDCSTSPLTPSDIYGNPVVLPTAQTYTYNVSDLTLEAKSFYYRCFSVYNTAQCLPETECTPCGRVIKFKIGDGEIGGDPSSIWFTCDSNGFGAYYIEDDTDAQNNIYNISYSLTGNSITSLNLLIDVINLGIIKTSQDGITYEKFWNNDGTCVSCCPNCGDKRVDFTGFMTTNITEVKTLETFENLLVSELTDVKNRKVISAYPTLRAVYERYMNATEYGVPQSNEFDYYKMDKFTGLIKSYWDDLIEQVVPATTMWGSVKVYTNTMFDQQKFKYRSYSSLFCNSPLNFVAPPSPINGSEGQCEEVEVVTYYVPVFPVEEGQAIPRRRPVTYNSICLTQMNWGSEFVGNVDIYDGNGFALNDDSFCDNICRKAVWYSMPESPAFVMNIVECGLMPETGVTFVINSLSVSSVNSGSELISVPLTSDTVTNDSVIWVPANNTVISACTLGNTTGWTYSNFVDFLNETFIQLGLTDYEARLSYIEIDSQTFSDGSVVAPPLEKNRAGFYLIFPENDTFELRVYCTSQLGGLQTYVYSNDNLYIDVVPEGNVDLIPYANSSFGVSLAVNYDCKTDTIYE